MTKTFVITGASRGLGLEFVKQLKSKGHTLFACVRNPNSSSELQALAGQNVHVIELDTINTESVAAAAQKIAELSPNGIDVLINNSGIIADRNDTVETSSGKSYLSVFETNVVGTSNVTQAILPLLRKGTDRRIINISSDFGSIASTEVATVPSYRISKAAENMLTKLFANHLKDESFVVVSIHPGWVQTDMGGSDATLTTPQSIGGILNQVEKLTTKDNGTFIDFQGASLPW
ncbi:4-dihydrotrisporin dehydrogenase [Phycomyces blakesleeanus]|uniref:Uncharacterized protein n=2 Tax=Phycomyces blakesleeanus TaxID=4837 RepID=A0A162PJR4_PHYB8|nr:hypothetical protein PHYBLDRAFT_168867 [Phycomyces blakesleeanus NRRL 1555(-)]OAD73517.1 hypothetical protein PHYBLDRAFT_168867 [Phycomyces blakesleeanus NRRL 1555(-)]|eukprot:XP_018291557.1 hypothetical protein PHYBLDRAFT_168867 [Phycomyces blakesleeanus NRRL 1555(-)]